MPPAWKTIAPIGCGTSSMPYKKKIDIAKRKPVDEMTQINNLMLNESIRLTELTLPEGAEIPGLDEEHDQMVVSVNAPRAEEEEVEIEAEGEEGEESGEDNAEEANDSDAAEDDSDESS